MASNPRPRIDAGYLVFGEVDADEVGLFGGVVEDKVADALQPVASHRDAFETHHAVEDAVFEVCEVVLVYLQVLQSHHCSQAAL